MPSAFFALDNMFLGKVVPNCFKASNPIIPFSIFISISILVFNKSIISKVERIISGPIPSPSNTIILTVICFPLITNHQ